MKVLIAGGGTAGHVNPALALAEAMVGDDILFVGTDSGVESSLVPAKGHEFKTIDVRGFDRAKPLSLFGVGLRAVGATRDARKLLKQFAPDVVVGMGGYVSLPVSIAARTLGIPVVLHEQNIVFGLANKVAKRFAAAVAVSFEESLEEAGRKGVFVGNPVSKEVADADLDAAKSSAIERFGLDPTRKTLLVFGGSQGALRVNDAARGLASRWSDRTDLQVLHIAGKVQAGSVEQIESQEGELIYKLVDYVDRMVEAYAVADVALCRGGATTVAELCVTGVPSVIVPYPHHRDQQQEKHARVLERAGAAVTLLDEQATSEKVGETIEGLVSDDAKLKAMSDAAKALGRPDAAERLADVVRKSAA
jgi:UDP-N-acetylglucosamine--N-acetylmuramyl-(pentapeptide) pyrophosphoryl-undecaprenol N-acetylglucosamine transferase